MSDASRDDFARDTAFRGSLLSGNRGRPASSNDLMGQSRVECATIARLEGLEVRVSEARQAPRG